MVMKKNAMRKNLTQSILKSLGRYLAIVMIIALGASMFVGLLMTKSDMVATGQKYMDEQNMFDLRLISPYGWDKAHGDIIAEMDGVADAEGVLYLDAIASLGDVQENAVYRFYGIPEKLNQIALRGGRMPEAPDECLADGYMMTDEVIGMQVHISDANEESTLDAIKSNSFTVVGYVASPLYMDMNRGSTSVGSGSLSSFFYVPAEALDVDYYSEIHVTIPGDFRVYTDTYNDAMEAAAEKLEPMVEPLVAERFQTIRDEAMEEYNKGLQEYEDGLKTFEEEKEKALQELDSAYRQLVSGQAAIKENEVKLAAAEEELEAGKEAIAENEKTLAEGRKTLEDTKAALYGPLYAAISSLEPARDRALQNLQALEAEIAPIDEQLAAVNASIAEQEAEYNQLSASKSALDSQISDLNGQIGRTQAALNAAKLFPLLNASLIERLSGQLAGLQSQRDAAVTQRDSINPRLNELEAQLAEPWAQRAQLQQQRSEIEPRLALAKSAYDLAQSPIDDANAAITRLDEEFAPTEAELAAGEQQLADAKLQLEEAEKQIADGWAQIHQGKAQISKGWKEYEEGKVTAEEEFAKAEKELAEAKMQLDDALDTINGMDPASIYVLDRNSNVGYGSLNSASDIVFGVSKVFPAFFLLVAALVCITTMTRMIDEERTQIGTLKALGYSSGAIISKYLIYAGSGAVVGCGIGVMVGSMAFPTILWEAHKIMLYVDPVITLQFNWALCLVVVAAYTAVMLFVTWYCCRRALNEEPAELIRPKAPEAGKKILLEYLPFWHKISFLNKVTIRNIFRYRQRLAMMLVGIGGCTALLLTGFGLRDSITNVVDFQFENVTVYDMTVYFSEGQTREQQERFAKLTDDCVKNMLFYNQISVELEHHNEVKEIYLMVSDSKIQEFIDFRSGEEPLSMPGTNEVLLTVGVAENLGIQVGDQVTMRNADMEQLELTVSGIYDNHVNNYAVVIPATIETQWNRSSEEQMAMVQVAEGQDVYAASTVITDLSGVQNVSISQDLANMVGSMMDALDLVVWVIVVCAGMLAVTVLYNLTNININERIREIATIKVLGFNASETAAYVFKENLSLTVFGAGVGLGLGYLLLIFVMSQIKIDMVWFKATIMWPSYLWAVVLTILSACIVNFVFYFKLDKINMAEALKSVE